MSRYPRSRGFTLVELLVVIAIIGTLVALLLPAVQQAREAARRMTCSNNLHNLSIALQNYHDSIGSFPSAWITAPDTQGGYGESWGWGVLMLPFLEQKNLHTALTYQTSSATSKKVPVTLAVQFGSTNPDPTGFQQMITTPLKVFICPSDTGYFQNHLIHSDRAWGQAGDVPVAVSNYVGVEGHLDAVAPGSGTPFANTGIMWGDSYCRMADVVDGTSNTMAFGERQSLISRGASWLGVYNPSWTIGSGTRPPVGPTLVVGHAQPKPNEIEDSASGYYWNSDRAAPMGGFSSLHPNGAQFAFCDGSVRWINNQINHNWCAAQGKLSPGALGDEKIYKHPTYGSNGVYQALMSRNEKIPITGDY